MVPGSLCSHQLFDRHEGDAIPDCNQGDRGKKTISRCELLRMQKREEKHNATIIAHHITDSDTGEGLGPPLPCVAPGLSF